MTALRRDSDGVRPPTRAHLLRQRAQEVDARNAERASDGDKGTRRRPLDQWESEQRGRQRRLLAELRDRLRPHTRGIMLTALAFLLGLQLAARPETEAAVADMRHRLTAAEVSLQARQGELELVRLEMARLQEIADYSRRYRIPADLAGDIIDIALAEGVDPSLAFRLVQVESGFYLRAVSPKGAVGLAQLMPATAFELDPSLSYSDLFDRRTNLRLGFRYLRKMIDKYGDVRLALLAYNRGPGTVDSIRREGGDPANGYARAVLSGR